MNQEEQIETYGCTVDELKKAVIRTMEIERQGPVKVAMIYSTFAKNMILADNKVGAVQYLNRLKWVLSTYHMNDGK